MILIVHNNFISSMIFSVSIYSINIILSSYA